MDGLTSLRPEKTLDDCILGADGTNGAMWRLLSDNIRLILREADKTRRIAAIGRLWVPHPLVYDAGHAIGGMSAVSAAADRFLAQLGADDCVIDDALGGEDGFYMIRWHAERNGTVTGFAGCHLAYMTNGRIDSLFMVEESPISRPSL